MTIALRIERRIANWFAALSAALKRPVEPDPVSAVRMQFGSTVLALSAPSWALDELGASREWIGHEWRATEWICGSPPSRELICIEDTRLDGGSNAISAQLANTRATQLVIWPDWFYASAMLRPLNLVLRIDRVINKWAALGLKTVFFPPDIGDPLYSAFMDRATIRTGGVVILQSQTIGEASMAGLSRAIGPYIYLYPDSYLGEMNRWIQHRPQWSSVLLPRTHYGIRRAWMQELEEFLVSISVPFELAPGDEPIHEYFRRTSQHGLIATTNLTQDYFLNRPGGKRLPRTTTTGRTWEAFAMGRCALANRTVVLDSLGFQPGKDYVDLDLLRTDPGELARLVLNADGLRTIAHNGHARFMAMRAHRL